MAGKRSEQKVRSTMVQLSDRLVARTDHMAAKLVLNRSAFIRQALEEMLMRLEPLHGTAPESEMGVVLPLSVGPTRLDNDRIFWVSYNGNVEKLKESIIIERYLIPKVPGVMVANEGSQEWRVPEELGIKIPSIIPPPPFVPKPAASNGAPAPYVPSAPAVMMPPPPAQLPPPAPPQPPKLERKFWIAFGTEVKRLAESDVQDIINADPSKQICLEGETEWKSASDYGLTPKLEAKGAANGNGNGMESRSGTPALI